MDENIKDFAYLLDGLLNNDDFISAYATDMEFQSFVGDVIRIYDGLREEIRTKGDKAELGRYSGKLGPKIKMLKGLIPE